MSSECELQLLEREKKEKAYKVDEYEPTEADMAQAEKKYEAAFGVKAEDDDLLDGLKDAEAFLDNLPTVVVVAVSGRRLWFFGSRHHTKEL